MPLYDEDTPLTLFDNALTHWEEWRDGIFDNDPLPTVEDRGFEVIDDYVSKDGHNIVYRKGMQGHLARVDVTTRVPQALVFIERVTQTGSKVEDRHKWIPTSKIKIGNPWKPNRKDWKILVEPSSEEVFGSTGWKVPSQRKEFGIVEGANCTSPPDEIATSKYLFLCMDFIMPDKDKQSGENIATFEFRTAMPRKAHYHIVKGDYILKGPVTAWSARSHGRLRRTPHFNVKMRKAPNGIDMPLEGSDYYLAYSVRKNGKEHPNSYAQLSDVGLFKNWEQANSLAQRIEWEHPPKSGTWRYRYIYASSNKLIDPNVPGSFSRYAFSIMKLHWLFSIDINPQGVEAWFPIPISFARVLRVRPDYTEPCIHISRPPPSPEISILPSVRKSDKEIEHSMKNPKFKLQNVNTVFKPAGLTPQIERKRKTCDACLLARHPVCDQVKNLNLCTRCQDFLGLPCCSFTKDIDSAGHDSSGRREGLNGLIFSALLGKSGGVRGAQDFQNSPFITLGEMDDREEEDEGEEGEEFDEGDLDELE